METATPGPAWWRRAQRIRVGWRRLSLRPPPLLPSLDAEQIQHLISLEGSLVTVPPNWLRDGNHRGWRFTHISRIVEPRALPPLDHSYSWSADGGKWKDDGGKWASDDAKWSGDGAKWSGTGGSWLADAARGAPLAAVLLLTLALLIRAVKKCRSRKLFKSALRRRQSEEWPTPSVAATTLSVRMSDDATDEDNVDIPPPPYAAAAAGAADAADTAGAADAASAADTAGKPHAELPPPYSACYTAYRESTSRQVRQRQEQTLRDALYCLRGTGLAQDDDVTSCDLNNGVPCEFEYSTGDLDHSDRGDPSFDNTSDPDYDDVVDDSYFAPGHFDYSAPYNSDAVIAELDRLKAMTRYLRAQLLNMF